jgi:hypothetical protein
MIYWYEQVFYGIVLFALIEIFKFYVLENEDIGLMLIKYFRKKNDSK